jgi:hypothetical protein
MRAYISKQAVKRRSKSILHPASMLMMLAVAWAVAGSCASLDEEIVDFSPGESDAGSDSSAFGGTSGNGFAGSDPGDASTLGSDAGGDSSADVGAAGGGGAGGVDADESEDAADSGESDDGGGPGTCDPYQCPLGLGWPCCVTEYGPCGLDIGFGCQAWPPVDF